MTVGSSKLAYEEVVGWGRLPEGRGFGEVPGVAVDSQDRVYAFSRSDPPLIVFDREGNFLKAWGADMFKRPHSLFIGPDDAVYCTDDWGHAVHKFTTDGELLMTIETADQVADTGFTWDEPETVLRAGPPFNHPTAVALSPEGDLYVSDGYGNARVHKFTAEGQLLFSWGEPGNGDGQFVTPHNVCVDQAGVVYVADRQNCRIQLFSPQGEFVTQWPDLWWPCDMCMDADGNMYVAEVGGLFMGADKKLNLSAPQARISVRDQTGKILAEWGVKDPLGAGVFFSPHNIAIDSRGDLYVGEVTASYTGGAAPADWPVLRKYALDPAGN